MSAIVASIKREPVRWFTGLDLLVQLVLSGLLLFTDWNPTTDQIVYILGVPTAIAAMFGFSIVRNAVTPNDRLPDAVVERARDAGQSTITLIVLIVLVVLAFFGAAHIFGWSLGT